jgi:DHA1 family bicyclomycin/chloramphenicol resistance-like MFS transporter
MADKNFSSGWKPSRYTVMLLIGLTALAPLSIDMFLPSMPRMAEQFKAAPSKVQLAVTFFIIAMAVGQLLFGPASDRFGRRRTMLIGLGVYAVAGAFCGLATTISVLLFGRICQGFAAGSGPSVGQAVVRDIYGRERTARVLATMTTAMALAPMLAPVAGGYLQVTFGWRSVFVVLGGFGTIYFLAYLLMIPETNLQRDPEAMSASRLFGNIKELVGNRIYIGNVLIMTTLFAGFFAFIANSSFVLIEILGLSPDLFGYCFGFVAFGFMCGGFTSRQLHGRFDPRQLVFGGMVVVSVAGLSLGGQALTETYAVLPIVGSMYLWAVGGGMAMPMAAAEALVPYPEKAGLASSVMGFLRNFGTGLSGVIYVFVYDGTPNPMLFAITGASLLGLILCTILLRSTETPRLAS